MARQSKRGDLARLRDLLTTVISPFNSPDMDFLAVEDKLMYAIRPNEYPIYRRKLLKSVKVTGLWWMQESQWTRFMWKGQGKLIKSGQDPDRCYTTHSFNNLGYCYIRENDDHYDLEAMSRTAKWDVDKQKDLKTTACEWLTVSISKEEYTRLQEFLGPVDECCKHTLA